jgi:hypothetical protein
MPPIASIEDVKNVSDVIGNAVTAFAVIIGGVWAYLAFIRERTLWPRAELDLALDEHQLDSNTVLLSARLKVHNGGRGLMKLDQLRMDLHQVKPLGDEMRRKIDSGMHFNSSGVEAAWPLIDQHVRTWEDDKPEIEPGEADEFCLDFFIDPSIETIFVYAYLENVRKRRRRRRLGWPLTRIHDLRSHARESATCKEEEDE